MRVGSKVIKSYRFDYTVDQHQWRLRVVVDVQPGSVQLQQELQARVNVKAAQRDGTLSALTAGVRGCLSAHIIRLRAVEGVRGV